VADTPDVPAPVRTLAAQVAEATPMRRGSLSERYVKCSKPGCACAERPAARHGPYYSLTQTVGGRTQSRFTGNGCGTRSSVRWDCALPRAWSKPAARSRSGHGLHRTVAGAALRCCKLRGRFEDFWKRRSAARVAAA
jgi:hypothetical protein